MSQFVIEVSDSKATSVFLEFIRSLNFVRKVEKVSTGELDNRILQLGRSIKKKHVSDIEILSAVKSFRRKQAE